MQEEATSIKKVYKEIQSSISKLIPEKWESIYLYASVINGKNGEMFFYYFPRKILKHKPINCYEIPSKFGIDEKAYNEALEKLYAKIKNLNHLTKSKWTNITLSIVNNIFSIEYHYNNLEHSMYTDEERHIVWNHKYLKTPIDSFNEKEKQLIESYEEESSIKPTIYTEGLYKIDEVQEVRNQILKY